MRHGSNLPLPAAEHGDRRDWQTIRTLFPYLWRYPRRVSFALVCLIGAKLANVSVPLIFKHVIDALTITREQAFIVVPAALLLAYGALRFSTSMFTELREIAFARVTQEAVRNISLEVFRHLHALSLRFHLERQTGGLTRDIERGTRSLQTLVSYSLYTIIPTLVELSFVLVLLGHRFDMGYVWITLAALLLYGVFTISITEWHTKYRKAVNELDSKANTKAIDALINFETVKY